MDLDTIYNEDCLETMRRMPDGFVDLTVTSPPYDNLRKYNGYCFDFENVAKELYRVTKLGGVVVWVVADATVNGSETGTSFRQALYFMQCGFNLYDTMIYASDKPPMNCRRYQNSFEYMFVFSKGMVKTFNALREQCIQVGRQRGKAGFRRPNGELLDRYHDKPTGETKVRGNIWKYSTGFMCSSKDKIAFEHPAIFPEQLASDHIVSWSNEGDVVYDCFLGSGTTAKMAAHLKRRFIGSEISSDYYDIALRRIKLEQQQQTLF